MKKEWKDEGMRQTGGIKRERDKRGNGHVATISGFRGKSAAKLLLPVELRPGGISNLNCVTLGEKKKGNNKQDKNCLSWSLH